MQVMTTCQRALRLAQIETFLFFLIFPCVWGGRGATGDGSIYRPGNHRYHPIFRQQGSKPGRRMLSGQKIYFWADRTALRKLILFYLVSTNHHAQTPGSRTQTGMWKSYAITIEPAGELSSIIWIVLWYNIYLLRHYWLFCGFSHSSMKQRWNKWPCRWQKTLMR